MIYSIRMDSKKEFLDKMQMLEALERDREILKQILRRCKDE